MNEMRTGVYINQETVRAVKNHPDYHRYSDLVDKVATLQAKKQDEASGFGKFSQEQKVELDQLSEELKRLDEAIKNDTSCDHNELLAIINDRYQR